MGKAIKIVLLGCLATTAMPGAAHAQVSDSPVAASPAPANPEPALVCRRITPTGSNISKRVCRTKAAWQSYQMQIDDMDQQLRRSRGVGPGVGN